jgi:hypothetical protein
LLDCNFPLFTRIDILFSNFYKQFEETIKRFINSKNPFDYQRNLKLILNLVFKVILMIFQMLSAIL